MPSSRYHSQRTGPTRIYNMYFETGTPYEVPSAFAQRLYPEALAKLSPLVGQLVIAKYRGVSPTTDGDPLEPRDVQLPGIHRAFVTRHEILTLDGTPGIGRSNIEVTRGGDITESKTFISTAYDDPKAPLKKRSSLFTAVHELAHSFNVGHCGVRSCIMRAELDLLRLPSVNNNPFCNNCQTKLQQAGQRERGENP